MAQFWRVYLAMCGIALVATFALAAPQAAAIGAPDRGFLASGVTMVAFFLALLLVACLFASVLSLPLAAGLARLGLPAHPLVPAGLAALLMAVFLQILPGGGDANGFMAGWIAAAVAGVLVVDEKADNGPRFRPKHFAIACLVSIAVGLIALRVGT